MGKDGGLGAIAQLQAMENVGNSRFNDRASQEKDNTEDSNNQKWRRRKNS
jgi:hypothetical protein